VDEAGEAPRAEYERRLARRRERVAHGDRLDRRISAARGVTFLAGALVAWLSLARGELAAEWLLVPGGIFLALVVLHERVIRAKRLAERAVAHYERGLARLDERWVGQGARGERFLESDPGIGEDLDLFGEGSLFELLSTARTGVGESTLADWLRHPAEPAEIRARQEAVSELRSRLDLREQLALLGRDVTEAVEPAFLVAWAEKARDDFPAVAAIAGAVLTSITTAALVYWQAFDGAPEPFLVAAAAQALFAGSLRRKVDAVLEGFDRATRNLSLLAEILVLLEREPVATARLVAIRRSLETDGLPPSRRIAKLAVRAYLLDSRKNQFFAPFAALLLWRTQLAISIARWRVRHGAAVGRWVSAIGDVEALLSFASHAYEHPADPFPEILSEGSIFDGEGLAHPLLPEGRAVRNDLRLGGELRAVVVSGSNMSGKSTLLRTVGVNVVLALAGATVRATRLRLSPMTLGTSIRVRDSLREGRSRFYAEIVRLREILDRARTPLPLLFLLDEVLHGTNSHDRRIGSEGVIRELLARGAIGLVTTHDLALAAIADALVPRAANVHFEDHLEDGKMTFDYRIRPGVVEKSNALALMRAVGIDV
jgi:hypothetical protein